jgi:fatty-acid desaturase
MPCIKCQENQKGPTLSSKWLTCLNQTNPKLKRGLINQTRHFIYAIGQPVQLAQLAQLGQLAPLAQLAQLVLNQTRQFIYAIGQPVQLAQLAQLVLNQTRHFICVTDLN